LFQCRLPLQQPIELLFNRFLVEKLPTDDAVHLRAQVSNMVFIGDLHLGRREREDVIAKREISTGCNQPHQRDDQRESDGRHPRAYSAHDDGRDGETLRPSTAPPGRASWAT
jgi:hypothetical protein